MDQKCLDSRVLLSGMIALKGSLKLSTHLYWVGGVEGYSVHVRTRQNSLHIGFSGAGNGHLRPWWDKISPCCTGNLLYNCLSSTGKGVL